jgi:hypothetical protein
MEEKELVKKIISIIVNNGDMYFSKSKNKKSWIIRDEKRPELHKLLKINAMKMNTKSPFTLMDSLVDLVTKYPELFSMYGLELVEKYSWYKEVKYMGMDILFPEIK